MAVHPLAGQVAPYESQINVPRLIAADSQLPAVVREKIII